jgi:holdfast attachment protein HfaA
MQTNKMLARFAFAAGLAGAAVFASAGHAANLGDSSSYNTPFGMASSASENAPVDPSLRDQNGNLSLVNGQFQSSAFAQGFGASSSSASSLANLGSGASSSGSGVAFGGASAIGNSLNVVTVGNNNTVIVNSSQTNTGNVTATTTLNGH